MFQGTGLVNTMDVLVPLRREHFNYIEKYYILFKYLSNSDYTEHFTA